MFLRVTLLKSDCPVQIFNDKVFKDLTFTLLVLLFFLEILKKKALKKKALLFSFFSPPPPPPNPESVIKNSGLNTVRFFLVDA